jgi:hypothetical protein
MNQEDKRVIACNYVVATSECRQNAFAYLSFMTGGENSRIQVLARSRSGRWVHRWEPLENLGHFRYKSLPPEHPLYGDERVKSDYLGWNGWEIDWLKQNSEACR